MKGMLYLQNSADFRAHLYVHYAYLYMYVHYA